MKYHVRPSQADRKGAALHLRRRDTAVNGQNVGPILCGRPGKMADKKEVERFPGKPLHQDIDNSRHVALSSFEYIPYR